MLGPAWVALFRKLPPTLHDSLVMITATGAEVMIQRILILEEDYLVFRGRMAGVQDIGLVMMMPYDQISNLAVAKRMLEPELRQIFSGSEFLPVGTAVQGAAPAADKSAAAEQESAAAEQESAAEQADDDPAEQPAAPAPAADKTAKTPEAPGKPSQPSKSTLLAKLRARLAGKAKS